MPIPSPLRPSNAANGSSARIGHSSRNSAQRSCVGVRHRPACSGTNTARAGLHRVRPGRTANGPLGSFRAALLYAGAELSGEAPIGPLGSGDAAGGWEPHAIAGVESHLQQRSLPPNGSSSAKPPVSEPWCGSNAPACGRRGQYRIDRLLERFPPEIALPDLRHELAQCPQRGSMSHPCQVEYARGPLNVAE